MMKLIICLFLCVCLCDAFAARRKMNNNRNNNRNNRRERERQTIPTDYNGSIPPEGSTNVRIGFYFNSIRFGNNGDVQAVLYLRQGWRDPRLAGLKETTRVSVYDHGRMWKPDLFFRNAIKSGIRENGITKEQLIRLNETGHVWDVIALEATFYCPDLFKRNLTTVVCPIMVESFGYTMDHLRLSWLDSPVDVDPNIWLDGFTLTDTALRNCSRTYTAGSFPCLETSFHFRRDD